MKISIVFSAGLILLLTQSCVKYGCTDPEAMNFTSKAERNDGSCTYARLTRESNTLFNETYADIAHAMYEDAQIQALALQETIYLFLDNPTIPGLEACKNAWVLAHIPYSQAEGFRYAFGPADEYAERVNAWDFDPAYIDYTASNGASGIINNKITYPSINADLLNELNGMNNGRQITLGYHVIEFLLWGEDNTDPDQELAGQRTFRDYLENDSTVENAKRRGDFLRICVNQLVEDLEALAAEWSASNSNNYRKEFLNYSPTRATRFALTGLVNFSQFELAKYRLENALQQGLLYENEESTFSDNSARDLYFNVVGLKSIFNGRYGRTDSTYVEGFSLFELIEDLEPDYALPMQELSDDLIVKAVAIPSPLDYYLSIELPNSVGPVNEMISALRAYGNKLTDISVEMGIGVKADLLE